jgi:anaerobic selenocysteine-containing dehydrogenase
MKGIAMKHDGINSETRPETRREFLKTGAALGAVLGSGAAALLPAEATAAPEERVRDQPGPQGYKVTQHVLDYYRTARI